LVSLSADTLPYDQGIVCVSPPRLSGGQAGQLFRAAEAGEASAKQSEVVKLPSRAMPADATPASGAWRLLADPRAEKTSSGAEGAAASVAAGGLAAEAEAGLAQAEAAQQRAAAAAATGSPVPVAAAEASAQQRAADEAAAVLRQQRAASEEAAGSPVLVAAGAAHAVEAAGSPMPAAAADASVPLQHAVLVAAALQQRAADEAAAALRQQRTAEPAGSPVPVAAAAAEEAAGSPVPAAGAGAEAQQQRAAEEAAAQQRAAGESGEATAQLAAAEEAAGSPVPAAAAASAAQQQRAAAEARARASTAAARRYFKATFRADLWSPQQRAAEEAAAQQRTAEPAGSPVPVAAAAAEEAAGSPVPAAAAVSAAQQQRAAEEAAAQQRAAEAAAVALQCADGAAGEAAEATAQLAAAEEAAGSPVPVAAAVSAAQQQRAAKEAAAQQPVACLSADDTPPSALARPGRARGTTPALSRAAQRNGRRSRVRAARSEGQQAAEREPPPAGHSPVAAQRGYAVLLGGAVEGRVPGDGSCILRCIAISFLIRQGIQPTGVRVTAWMVDLRQKLSQELAEPRWRTMVEQAAREAKVSIAEYIRMTTETLPRPQERDTWFQAVHIQAIAALHHCTVHVLLGDSWIAFDGAGCGVSGRGGRAGGGGDIFLLLKHGHCSYLLPQTGAAGLPLPNPRDQEGHISLASMSAGGGACLGVGQWYSLCALTLLFAERRERRGMDG